MKKLTVSIGIAAYNAEKNIEYLLKALISQKQTNFKLNKIYVHSDNSSDKTAEIIKSLKIKNLILIENKRRKGFAGSLKSLIEVINEEVSVFLNDDIQIRDNNFINKLVKPFLIEDDIGLVCGHVLPLKGETFIEKSAISSFNAYDRMRLYIKEGNSNYSCDGKILVLNKKLINKINFPKNLKEMGNTDAYLYFSCIQNGFKFRFVRNAIVFSRWPQNISDLTKWQTRNDSNIYILKKRFGKMVDEEYSKPGSEFWKSKLYEFVKNPIGCAFLLIFGLYTSRQAKKYAKNFNPTWDVVVTSKKI